MDKSIMTPLSDVAGSKKRTADEITPHILSNDDNDSNGMLPGPYEPRKQKIVNENSITDLVQLENDNKIVTLKEFKVNEKISKEVLIEEAKEQKIEKSDKKWLYLSKLLFYRKEQHSDCMITFNQMMFEDLGKDPTNPTSTLEAAFMTTFGYEIELLEPLLKSNIQLVLANDMTLGCGLKLIERGYQGYPNLTLIHPPKVTDSGLEGAFHPKLWLLKFPSFLRVVVASGNLCSGAWSIWSNCLWFQDFPKKTDQKPRVKETSAGFDFNKDFKESLESFVQEIMPLKIDYKSILKFDLNDYVFENIDVILIPSVTGRYRDQSINKYGIGKIKHMLEKFPCQISSKPNRKIITYQSSSIGKVDEKYIGEFTASVLPGFKSLKELGIERQNSNKVINDPKQSTLFSFKKTPPSLSAVDRIRLIFPTQQYVEESAYGVEAGGCLFLKKDFYESGKLPKKIFHQFEAPGIVPHLKVFMITDDDNEINDDTCIYFGSHNFSPAAWGKYEKDFTQLSMINSELGVLIPPMKGTAERKRDLVENLSFKFPPKKYSTTDEPFFQ